MRKKCRKYFSDCENSQKVFSEAGLALALGVTLHTLRNWFDGIERQDLQEVVQMAYLRIQEQYESAPAFMQKGMATRAAFFLRRSRFGGDPPVKAASTSTADSPEPVTLDFGKNMDETDFL